MIKVSIFVFQLFGNICFVCNNIINGDGEYLKCVCKTFLLDGACLAMESSGLPITWQLQPISTPQIMLCTKTLKSGLHGCLTKYCNRSKLFLWILNKICTVSDSTYSVMARDVSHNQGKQTTFIWMLGSDSNQCALHLSAQYDDSQSHAWVYVLCPDLRIQMSFEKHC